MDAAKAAAVRDRIRGNFDRGAGAYARFELHASLFGRLTRELLARAPSLRPGWVLDVGCGTGASMAALIDETGPGFRGLGLDISLGMLREASRCLGSSASLVQMDGCHYGSAFRCRFEGVLYNAVLFMLPDARASLASARAVLRPGGLVLISSLERVAVGETSVADLLAARGLQPGRHALSPWADVLGYLRDEFAEVGTASLSIRLGGDEFLAFYGLEPMSAGLLPSLPYADRRTVLAELAGELNGRGERAEQVWNLAWARNPGEEPAGTGGREVDGS